MSFKKFKNRLETLLESKSKSNLEQPDPVKKKPVRSSAAFKRFMAESSYSQKKISYY